MSDVRVAVVMGVSGSGKTTLARALADAWEAIFAGTDACVTPVLDYVEAASHPANAARQAFVQDGRWLHPQLAPRLATQPLATHFDIATKGGDYCNQLLLWDQCVPYCDDAPIAYRTIPISP